MDIQQDEGEYRISFRLVTLPRSVRVEYPRSPRALTEDWNHRAGILTAVLQGEIIGYTSLTVDNAPLTTWVTDLVVMRRLRRQGVGSALILAAQQWAKQKGSQRIIMEMQPKNYPAICLSQKLGFDLCGYNDRYYANRDIALFFGKGLR
jgi:GNAT superfamily N-acetyltransferase